MERHQDRSARRAERLKGGSTVKGFFNKHLGALLALLIVLTIPVGMVWAKYALNLTVTDKLSLTVTAAVTKEYTIDKQKMWKALRALNSNSPTALNFVTGSDVPPDAKRIDTTINLKGIQAAESGEIGVFLSKDGSTIYIAPVDRNHAVMYAPVDCSEFLSKPQTYYSGRTSLATVDLGNLDTSKVTYMNKMFYNCKELTTLDLGNLDTSNVTDMSSMFYGCSGMTTIDLSKFDTACVTNMSSMFKGCSNLSTLDVKNFNTSKVIYMQSMFESCRNITTLDLSKFDTACVTDMSSMFNYCQMLTSLDLRNFDTACVTDMSSMFNYCQKLTSLDVSSFNTEKVTTMSYMFCHCESIQRIDLHSFSNTVLNDCSHMFEECQKVKQIHLCGFGSKTGMNIYRMFADMDDNNYSNATYIYTKSGMSIAGYKTGDQSAFYRSNVIGPIGSSRINSKYGYDDHCAKQALDGYFNACSTHTGSNAKSVTFDFSGLNNITAVPRGAE